MPPSDSKGSPARGEAECPLLFELEAIGSLSAHSVVMIDDARLFMAPPPAPSIPQEWPSFSDLLTHLHTLRSDHELMVIDDVIAFFPPRIGAALRAFARETSIDWLAELTRGCEFGRAVKWISALEAGLGGVQEKVGRLRHEIARLAEAAADSEAHTRLARERQEALVARVEAVYDRLPPLDTLSDRLAPLDAQAHYLPASPRALSRDAGAAHGHGTSP